MRWEQHQDDTLKTLNSQGLSAAQIAAQVSADFRCPITRNSVIGRLHRMGLTLTGCGVPLTPDQETEREERRRIQKARASSRGGFARAATLHRMGVKRPPEIPPAPENDADIPLAQRRSLFELEPHHCRWPVGDPGQPGFFFCAATQHAHGPYCSTHSRRAVQAAAPRPLDHRRFKWAA